MTSVLRAAPEAPEHLRKASLHLYHRLVECLVVTIEVRRDGAQRLAPPHSWLRGVWVRCRADEHLATRALLEPFLNALLEAVASPLARQHLDLEGAREHVRYAEAIDEIREVAPRKTPYVVTGHPKA